MKKNNPTGRNSSSFVPGRRYSDLHGKIVDWVEHKFEEGLSLYAAFNTKSGKVLGKTAARHTSAEFVAFLTDIVIMRYIRQYNKSPRTVKWKYADSLRHISTQSVGTAH